MAKDKKDKKPKDKKEEQAASGVGVLFMLRSIVLPLLIALLFLPTTILFAILMLPTLVAAVVDNNKPKMLALTVGALNLAGATTAWFELLRYGHSIDTAKSIAMDPQNVFISYGAAFVGWILYVNVTALIANVTSRRAFMRIHSIVKRQNALQEIWGGAVAPRRGQQAAAASKEKDAAESDEVDDQLN